MLTSNPAINQPIEDPLLEEKGITLFVKRLDLIHPEISGNKFYKLKYNLKEAKSKGKDTVLTFGGAYSNHIAATSFAARSENLNAIGIIRGDASTPLNPTLLEAQKNGMQLYFVSREDYRKKHKDEFIAQLNREFGDFFLIPEGGTNGFAIEGTKEILLNQDEHFTNIVCSIGTGGTYAGLASAIKNHQKLTGISSLKGEFIHQEMKDLLTLHRIIPEGKLEIKSNFHFGGYAKYDEELIQFIWEFYKKSGIVLDPIYTGKLAYAIWKMIQDDEFQKGASILMIHSGGLQGNRGFTERTGIKLPDHAG
ncbi:1-aminocyclopropane-1-carboxylate deaminase/D-cysteine desulfhydrase [Algoriphagus aestuarii]|nr:1-aminocyclopropane-1-carboxylate deaminase/D-cysteine desulfhydrase [Algoriphagus aestuarii]